MNNQNMKKLLMGFAIFMMFMLVCTLISKSIYAYRLPMVSTIVPESKYVEHIVEADGIIVAGGEKPVTCLPGLRIDSVQVHVGDRVEEGDVLFRIDLEDLEQLMEEKRDEIAKVSLNIDTILENQEIAQQKRDLELARAREDYDITARLKDTEVGRAAENYVQAEKDMQENGDDEEAADALQRAAYDEADAKAERDEAVKQAGRRVEDALLPDTAASDLEIARLELADLEDSLNALWKIKEGEGVAAAPSSGVVTEIFIGVGDRVPDTAALLISDESLPCQLKVTITKDQKKYISLGDQVTVKLEGQGKELEETIDYLAESKSVPEGFEALINLPENTGVPGVSGTISRSEPGEKYKLCIPPTALYKKDDRYYVYVLKEREGILGEEYYVEEVNVKVLDQNDNWAAIEEGALDQESRIITSSTKEVSKGDVVRWEQ
ncbi:MAG: biotin/lipoyl-binding protein [Bacillota bacterium]|nr:biotin/lipoyl-binding protein [Bacillota bacterium]